MNKLMGTLLVVAACGEVKDKPPGTFSLTIDPEGAFVRRGQSIDVEITVARDELANPIDITVDNLPVGVTADALEIEEDGTTATLTINADATATHGIANLVIQGAVVDHAEITADAPDFRILVGGQPGDLDQSFAGDGTFIPTLGALTMVCRGLVLTSQGIVVTGIAASNPLQTITTRTLEDGSLDPSFGTGGFISTGFPDFAQGLAVAALADGSLVVAGSAGGDGGNTFDFGVYKYDVSGMLDPTFGVGGIASFDPGTGFAEWHSLVLAPDGTIFVGGTIFSGGVGRGAKYSATGVRDLTFNISEANVNVQGSALQADGKLVMVGGLSGDFWVARYNANGSRDTGFGVGGIVTTDFGLTDEANGVIVLPDNKLLVVGISSTAPPNTTGTISLARYNTNGSLDITFGNSGEVATTTQFEARGAMSVVLHDSSVYFVGRRPGTREPGVARLSLDGTLDNTFGAGGVVFVDFGVPGTQTNSGGFGVGIDPDGRIVISGDVGPAGQQQMGMARIWF